MLGLGASGCSSRAPTPTNPNDHGSGSGSAARGSGAGSGSAVTPPPAKVTRADCLAVFDHIIALDLKERPPDHQLAPDQVATLRTEMAQQLMQECLERLPHQVACIRGAATTQAVRACKQQ